MVSHCDLDDLPLEETHVQVFDDPRTIRLSLPAGESIAEHAHPGKRVLVHVLTGSVTATVGGEKLTLSAGELIQFDGDAGVAFDAERDVTALVVLA